VTRILVIDDQPDTLELLQQLFRSEGYAVDAVQDGASALEHLERVEYDVVFTDLRLGYPYDGIEILEMVKQRRPRAQVLIMTAFSSVQSSVLAMKGGAYDYITKPFKKEEVLLLAARAAERAQLAERVRSLEEQVEAGRQPTEMIGSSEAMVDLMRVVGQVARTDSTVLIVGESGTGKELVAQAIHHLSPRSERPFVPVNCGAIPETLQESEFFGHVKGAFTGAIRTKTGLFQQADTGTLFLDEVSETSLGSQVKLLRFLQEGEIRKVGENRPVHVDVRLVAATNRDLLSLIENKQFREDLYYRLNIIAIEVPPLRERPADIEELASFFLARCARRLRNGVTGFTDEAMNKLRSHVWPGNVRELENAVERSVTLARGTLVAVADLPRLGRFTPGGLAALGSSGRGMAARGHSGGVAGANGSGMLSAYTASEGTDFPSMKVIEKLHIEQALVHFEGNRARASAALGISKATLWRKIKNYGITL